MLSYETFWKLAFTFKNLPCAVMPQATQSIYRSDAAQKSLNCNPWAQRPGLSLGCHSPSMPSATWGKEQLKGQKVEKVEDLSESSGPSTLTLCCSCLLYLSSSVFLKSFAVGCKYLKARLPLRVLVGQAGKIYFTGTKPHARAVLLKPDCTVESPESFTRCLCKGPTHGGQI